MCTDAAYKLFNPHATGEPNINSLVDIARGLKEIGYNGIEVAAPTLSPDFLQPNFPENGAPRIRKVIENLGMQIVSLHWLLAKTDAYLTHPTIEVQDAAIETIVKLIKLAAALGCNVVVHGSPAQRNLLCNVSHSQAFDIIVRVYKSVMRRVENLGVTVCFEQLSRSETDVITTMADLSELVQAVGHEFFRAQLDFKALFPACQSAEEAAEVIIACGAGGRFYNHVHANDPTSMSGPGTGEWNMDLLFQTLKNIGYKGHISVEIFDFMKPGKVFTMEGFFAVAQKSMECIKKCWIV